MNKRTSKKLRQLAEQIDAISKSSVFVGVLEGSHTTEGGDSISMAGLAAAHEFGTDHIPERSFLRSTLIKNKEKYTAAYAKRLLPAHDGSPLEDVHGVVGAIAAGDVQKKIEDGISPELDEQTVKRKGSSKPLIDTGQLVQSITYVVRHD